MAMRIARGCALSATALAALQLMTISAVGQTPSASHRVAAVDIAHIFKSHPYVSAQVKKVEGELKAFEAVQKEKKEKLEYMNKQLDTMVAGTKAYKNQAKILADMKAKMALEAARRKQELARSEAKVYQENYERILVAVRSIAARDNINLVVRVNRERSNLDDPKSVTRVVMKNFVHFDVELDITDEVMRQVDALVTDKKTGTEEREKSTKETTSQDSEHQPVPNLQQDRNTKEE